MPETSPPPASAECPLCVAEELTPWYHDDELCWIAECTICALPMVVWRSHDPTPSDPVKAELHARLFAVVEQHFTFTPWIDDHMRQIPDHYHAHARPEGGFFGHPGLRRPPEVGA